MRTKARRCCSPKDKTCDQSASSSRRGAKCESPAAERSGKSTSSVAPSPGYAAASRSVPIGIYGRCGMNMETEGEGPVTFPDAYGQRPASARRSVDFPEPDAPFKSTCSPSRIKRFTSDKSGAPDGNFTETPARRKSCAAVSLTSGSFSCAADSSRMCASKVKRRSAHDCHAARLVYTSTKYDIESCTLPKQLAICIRPPSDISFNKYRGSATTKGNIIATCMYPFVSHDSCFCFFTIKYVFAKTSANRFERSARSLFAPA